MSMLLNPTMSNYSLDFDDVPVMEGYDVETGGDAAAHQEFVQEMVGVYEAMHAMDMAEITLRKRNGGIALESCTEGLDEFEMVQEAAGGAILEKIKNALKKLWAKIKAFFKSIRKYFDYLFMNAKDFAKKYQTQIVKAAARADDSFELKMYKYNDSRIDNIEGAKLQEKALSTITAVAQSYSVDKINELDNEAMQKTVYVPYRKFILNGMSTTGDAEDFSTDAFAYFRNGAENESDKVEVKASQIPGFLKVLVDTKTQSELEKMERAMDKAFRDIIKNVDNDQKKAMDKDDQTKVKYYAKLSSGFEGCQTIATTFVRIWHQAVKERAGAYKQACMKIMTHKNKKN